MDEFKGSSKLKIIDNWMELQSRERDEGLWNWGHENAVKIYLLSNFTHKICCLPHAIGKNIHAIGYFYIYVFSTMLRHRGQSVSNPHCRPQCVEAEMKEKNLIYAHIARSLFLFSFFLWMNECYWDMLASFMIFFSPFSYKNQFH